jgi:hypothetical protein
LMDILRLLQTNGIPLNRMVDVRSNPAVRGQLQAIVRRAAVQPSGASPASPAPSVAPAPGAIAPSIAQRLQELETLRASGALSDEEYKAKRTQIISEI